MIFQLFLLVSHFFQAILLSFVPITRVFSCQKISKKGSPVVSNLKELNFSNITGSGKFSEI